MNLRAHAKINLNLAVLGVRPDGYHELKTVFQSLALHDTLRFERADERLMLACSSPGMPLDERNLVCQAARLVWEAAGRSGVPAGRAHITKRIPMQGGLGGGSADGAAALVGWNRLWEACLPPARLRELALRLGADVPFFLCAGTALGLNRGDELQPLADASERWVVLVMPAFGVSTSQAFRWWDEDGGAAAPSETPGATKAAGEPLAIFNDLEPPVSRRHPQLSEIRDRLLRAGASAAAMTGSGSTMFGLFETEQQARTAGDDLHDARWHVALTRTATRREAGFGLPAEPSSVPAPPGHLA